MSDDEIADRARIVAAVLSDHGLHVSTPHDGDLDDVERERWDACVEIARRLSAPDCGSRR